jgi:hypothetical protein
MKFVLVIQGKNIKNVALIKKKINTNKLMKQEQLEELAKDFYSDENQLMERIAFKRGYTECKENSYSEEEAKKLAFDFYYDMSHKMGVTENLISENSTNVDIWFEEYKNNDEIIDDSIFDVKMEQATNQSDKIKYFNYFLYKLYQHKGSKNDFGKNKINPLFFFLLNAVDGYILYDIFDDFYALPYGPIEKTINHLIKNQGELSFTITRFDLDKKSDFILFQDENTKLIDKAFDRLVTIGFIEKSVSYMVDLSMEHKSIFNARRNAMKENKLAYPISNDDLKNELKFFYE